MHKIITATPDKPILDCFSPAHDGEIYISVTEADFEAVIGTLAQKDIVLISLFCAENFEQHTGFTMFYVFEKRGCRSIVILTRQLAGNTASSVAETFPSACWFEREVRDGFGIEFPNAFDTRRLFLHDMYPADFHPLRKNVPNQPIVTKQKISPEEEYKFKDFTGDGVYQIPVGPVHAGIIEPGHFRFSVFGETILNLEVRMFYKHRGIEKLAEGKAPADCLPIAETISGDESAVNACTLSLIHISEPTRPY